ncbi:MAG: helix-turn-helix domain-containing protein [Bacteroidetes bacterium]|nr:helix-turn-helix domain-containing protein [Bacteroidota bacterium]
MTKHNAVREPDSGVFVASHAQSGLPADRLLEDFKRQGYPLERYHPPCGFDYYFGGKAYLGTIFLWRELDREPISETTLQAIRLLEPFIVFALSDLVARRQHSEPDVRVFTDALRGLTATSGLSNQELRVVILQLFGHSYKEMADMLGISVDGVKHHLKMIHRKTGARSYTELFAKYFTPRLDLRLLDEEGLDGMERDGIPVDVDPTEVEQLPPIETPLLEDPAFDLYYDPQRTIGERTRKFGEVAFGSMEEFAKALKIAPSNLQKYLNGERNPGIGMLQRLHELGCSVNSLIGGDGSIFADNGAGKLLRARAGAAAMPDASS